MKKKQTLRALPVVLTTLAAASTLYTTAARADDVPSNTIAAGLYQIFYHVKADDLSGPFVPPWREHRPERYADRVLRVFPPPGRLPRPGARVRRAAGYQDGWGRGQRPSARCPMLELRIATSKWAAPSALIEYKFFSESAALRPYVGVGVNYTSFYDRDVTAAGQAATGGPTRLSLTSSIGPIEHRRPEVQAGHPVERVRVLLHQPCRFKLENRHGRGDPYHACGFQAAGAGRRGGLLVLRCRHRHRGWHGHHVVVHVRHDPDGCAKMSTNTKNTPNARASTLFVLSGAVVMCRKNTR